MKDYRWLGRSGNTSKTGKKVIESLCNDGILGKQSSRAPSFWKLLQLLSQRHRYNRLGTPASVTGFQQHYFRAAEESWSDSGGLGIRLFWHYLTCFILISYIYIYMISYIYIYNDYTWLCKMIPLHEAYILMWLNYIEYIYIYIYRIYIVISLQ